MTAFVSNFTFRRHYVIQSITNKKALGILVRICFAKRKQASTALFASVQGKPLLILITQINI